MIEREIEREFGVSLWWNEISWQNEENERGGLWKKGFPILSNLA